jgi:peptide/nickel transport system permease protein
MIARRLPITFYVGMAVTALFALVAICGPLITPYSPTEITGSVWQSPSASHWLGTDNIGRDMLARLIFGCRTTLALAFAISILSFVVGVTFGLLVAVAPDWVDSVVSRIVDTVVSIPTLIVALMVLSVLGSSIPILIAIVGLSDSNRVYRIARVLAINVMARDFVEVAWLRGEGAAWIMFREVLPNIGGVLFAEFAIRFGFTILTISSLSFLGLGVQPPDADWGSMIRENAVAINLGLPAPILPALAIAVLSISVNLLVDGLPWYRRHECGLA